LREICDILQDELKIVSMAISKSAELAKKRSGAMQRSVNTLAFYFGVKINPV
jgi:hypothetical protein